MLGGDVAVVAAMRRGVMKVPIAVLVQTAALVALSGCGAPVTPRAVEVRPPQVRVELPVVADVARSVGLV